MNAKDLTKEPPRSPHVRLHGYVILARTIDKCRATLAGTAGEYHYECPLSRMLFAFKGVCAEEFKDQVLSGRDDEELALWFHTNGQPKTPEEIRAWSEEREAYSLYNGPVKRDFFASECAKLGLDPAKTTMFDWLDADDKASHAQPATATVAAG